MESKTKQKKPQKNKNKTKTDPTKKLKTKRRSSCKANGACQKFHISSFIYTANDFFSISSENMKFALMFTWGKMVFAILADQK